MKSFLLIIVSLLASFSILAQAPTISSLTATGENIKWYSASTGGTLYTGTETLVNGQTYYASQTVNGVESTTRLAITANLITQVAPISGTHTPAQTQVVWNWNAASDATGYKWSTANVYSGATDLGNVLTKTETSLTCNTAYTRYVWAYNASGCASSVTTLTQTTSSCVAAPSVSTLAVSNIGATMATLNGNISAINGANVTTRGFKYSTSSGFDPALAGTNISESGTYGTGAFSLSPSGLATTTTYYVRAYATNSAGTTYGDQVSFITAIQTEFNYTGGVQTFTVPAGITGITIEAWGAQGGPGSAAGGLGGYASGYLVVNPGQVVYIYVGGQSGYNGGGTGGLGQNSTYGGTGGGASDVRTAGTTLGNRVIVAGGGGGGGRDGSYTDCQPSPAGAGGSGGGNAGANGYSASCNCFGGGNGGGAGTVLAGGEAGIHSGACTRDTWCAGTAGSSGSGGVGSNCVHSSGSGGAGGGGGGYYGGGAGGNGSDTTPGGGGGGGSSYIGGVTSGSTTTGQRSGNGQIKITY